jgi:hypothetical protein
MKTKQVASGEKRRPGRPRKEKQQLDNTFDLRAPEHKENKQESSSTEIVC